MLRHFNLSNTPACFSISALVCAVGLAASYSATAAQSGSPGTAVEAASGHGAAANPASIHQQNGNAQGVRSDDASEPLIITVADFDKDPSVTKKVEGNNKERKKSLEVTRALAKQECQSKATAEETRKMVNPIARQNIINHNNSGDRRFMRAVPYGPQVRFRNKNKHHDTKFPESVFSLTPEARDYNVKCSSIRFNGFYGVKSGSPSYGEQKPLPSNAQTVIGAVEKLRAEAANTRVKAENHKGIVRIQAECTPRPIAEVEKILELEKCYVEADNHFNKVINLGRNKPKNQELVQGPTDAAHATLERCEKLKQEAVKMGVKPVQVQFEPVSCTEVSLN